MIDSIDRWSLASRFGIDDVHSKTRLELLRRFEQCGDARAGPGERFSVVAHEIDRMSGTEDPPAHPPLYMVNFGDLMQYGEAPGSAEGYGVLAPFAHTHRWLRETVATHCPFLRPSLKKHLVLMTAGPRCSSCGEQLYQLVNRAREALLQLDPREGAERIFKAMVVLLPDLPSTRDTCERLTGFRNECGAECECNDLQLGSFVPSAPGNHLPDPERQTPPLLVLRHETRILQQ